jgi:hypothetical protein
MGSQLFQAAGDIGARDYQKKGLGRLQRVPLHRRGLTAIFTLPDARRGWTENKTFFFFSPAHGNWSRSKSQIFYTGLAVSA